MKINKFNKYLIFIGLIIILLYTGNRLYVFYKEYRFKKHTVYTIGETTRALYGDRLKYEYQFDTLKLNGVIQIKLPAKYLFNRYVVKLSKKKPTKSIILLNIPVPDSILKAPILGWDTIEFKKIFESEK